MTAPEALRRRRQGSGGVVGGARWGELDPGAAGGEKDVGTGTVDVAGDRIGRWLAPAAGDEVAAGQDPGVALSEDVGLGDHRTAAVAQTGVAVVDELDDDVGRSHPPTACVDV